MPVTQSLWLARDLHNSVPVTPLPSFVNHYTVTTAETVTVPAATSWVAVTADADIWIAAGTAVVPSGDVTDGTGSFLLKAGVARCFSVAPAQTFSVISASGTAHVGVECYAK